MTYNYNYTHRIERYNDKQTHRLQFDYFAI